MKGFLFGTVSLVCAIGCGPRTAATTWGYSHWYDRSGPASMGSFEDHQKSCLEQVGVAGDPTNVVPNSAAENEFFECMHDAGWCTQAYHCDSPGA